MAFIYRGLVIFYIAFLCFPAKVSFELTWLVRMNRPATVSMGNGTKGNTHAETEDENADHR